MTKALLIPTQGQTRLYNLPEEGAYLTIRDLIGGTFDCVRLTEQGAVMYVHDEGLLIGLEPNVTATAFYGHPIAGDVLLVGSISPQGISDGEDYDLPEFFLSDDFITKATKLNNTLEHRLDIADAMFEMDLTPKVVSMTDEEFDVWLGVQ